MDKKEILSRAQKRIGPDEGEKYIQRESSHFAVGLFTFICALLLVLNLVCGRENDQLFIVYWTYWAAYYAFKAFRTRAKSDVFLAVCASICVVGNAVSYLSSLLS